MITKKDLMNMEGLFMLASIFQHGKKRKASELLGTSMDTINKYVSNLEKSLGRSLISSGGRGTKLTVFGEEVVDNARKIKTILDEMYKSAPVEGVISGEVRVGINLAVRPNLSSEQVGELIDKYPQIVVTSIVTDGDPDMRDLSYDIGICRSVPESSDLVLIYDKKVECGFFAAPSYLAKHGYPVDLQDMMQNYHLLNKIDSSRFVKGWKDVCKNAKYLSYHSNSTYDLNEVIGNGGGIGVMPMMYKEKGLVCLDNIPCESDLHYYLIARRSTKDIPRVRVLLNYYKEVMKKM